MDSACHMWRIRSLNCLNCGSKCSVQCAACSGSNYLTFQSVAWTMWLGNCSSGNGSGNSLPRPISSANFEFSKIRSMQLNWLITRRDKRQRTRREGRLAKFEVPATSKSNINVSKTLWHNCCCCCFFYFFCQDN